jgi:hypothetical protein
MTNREQHGGVLFLVALGMGACTYGATQLYVDGSEGTSVSAGSGSAGSTSGVGGGHGGGPGAGGSAVGSGGASGASSVSFSSGRAVGAMSGYAWVAMGAQDSLTSPTCDNSSSGGSSNAPITGASPCMSGTNWSNSDKLCVSGTIPVVVNSNYNDNWGIAIGVNASEPPATSAGSGTLGKSYASVTFTVTGTVSPANAEIRAVVHRVGDLDTTGYCAGIRSGSAVGLTSFNTACWDRSGTYLAAADIPNIDKVSVQVCSDVGSAYALTDFCLTGISFQ